MRQKLSDEIDTSLLLFQYHASNLNTLSIYNLSYNSASIRNYYPQVKYRSRDFIKLENRRYNII